MHAISLALAIGLMPATAHAATNAGGGVVYAPQPTVAKVQCVKGCATDRRIQGGSTARITGSNLNAVTRVVFEGPGTKGAVKSAAPKAHTSTALIVTVPIDAQTGPIKAMASGGVASDPSKPVKILPPPPPEEQADLTPAPGAPALDTATSAAKVFLGSQRGVVFSYRLGGSSPADVTVNLIRQSDGAIVQSWSQPQVAPNEVRTVRWTGVTAGAVQPEGRYAFRAVLSRDGVTATSAGAGDADRDAFDFYGHLFPVRGRHDYGQEGARFGAGRAGHSHQGQDVMAACGTKLVAAQGGTVKYAAYQGNAGNYIVIHGVDGTDNAYMHLAQPSPFSEGDKVFTGQQIGVVGDTGDATACHLHFEIWPAPGWYDGGQPIDPLPSLQAWDAIS
jgi:murein DD-endopeptidase MepM/ murein hydrolase activator NlpD